MERFPDIASLSQATEEEVNTVWAGLGYYRRARMLREGSIKVVEDFKGIYAKAIYDGLVNCGWSSKYWPSLRGLNHE